MSRVNEPSRVSIKLAAFLHSSVESVSAFDRLLAELAPDLPVRHTALTHLAEAGAEQLQTEAAQAVHEETEAGAVVVLCVCPRLAEAAEAAGLDALRADMEDPTDAILRAAEAYRKAAGNA